jgi:hydrogenase nickel incorporation protein HypA/HybF
MHEMGIAMQIVEIVTASIPEHLSGGRVKTVYLKVGRLSAIVVDSLRFCYEMVIKETPLEGSRLHISEVPVRVRCGACNMEWAMETPAFACPECGGDTRLLSGRELDVESIELLEGGALLRSSAPIQ